MGGSESKSVPTLTAWFWYEGKSVERPGDYWYNNSVKSCGVKELEETAEQHRITHLILEGRVPAHLDQLVPSLTHLKISRLPKQDHQILESIGELSNLQTLDLSNNQLTHLPESIGKLGNLQELVLRRNQLTHLPESIGELSNLQKLNLYNNQLTHLPESIGKLSNLQTLYLSDNKLTHLPESIGELSNLQELDLNGNQLTHLPESIGELSNLPKLYLSNNQLTHLPESIGRLSNLQKLYLSNNKLTHLPESIGELSNLQRLNLWENLLTHLPESIGRLSNLQKLNLNHNQLTRLPESIGKLSNLLRLELYNNQLTHLPESIGELSSLQELRLYNNQLTHLPESILKLSNLQELDLSYNKLTHLPESIGKLSNLQELNLSVNQLTHLPESIIKLSKLTKLDVRVCTSLHTPPPQVCKQGIGAIKQYFKDLEKGRGKILTAATIAVMGEKMAGKTSLIRTLQSKEKKRVLTVRRPETGRDDATRVFNVEEVPTDDMILRFVDVGGHEVYHSTYPLTLRDSCVPAIVINLKKYSILSKDKETGKTEAVRSLCFDTLSQLYISNPKLGAPLLVLTHIDLLDDDQSFVCVREDFVKQCELLRQRLLQEDQQLVGRLDGHFGNSNIPLFSESDIFCIGGKSDSFQVFESIIDALRLRCKKFLKIVPAIWEMIADALSSSSRPYVKFAELLQSLSVSHRIHKAQLEFILIYLYECGKILWYPNVVELKPYIFQNIPELTKLLCVLFAHDDDTKWETRLADEKPLVRSDGSIVEHEEYKEMCQRFRTLGIMEEDLLHHLIRSESSFTGEEDMSAAILILKEFRLLYGPTMIQGRESYLSPYFAKGYQSNSLPPTAQKPLRIRSQVLFKGLAIPRYFYGQTCVETLNQFKEDLSNDISLARNGVKIHQGDITIIYTHDSKSRKIMFEVAAESKDIEEGWQIMLQLIAALKSHVRLEWPASRYVIETACPHCLLKGDQHPKKEINPPWLNEKSNQRSPMKSMSCQQDQKIPACLKLPCMQLTAQDKEQLQRYVDKNWIKDEVADEELVPEDDSHREVSITTQEVLKQTAGQTRGSAVSHVYACEDDDSDLSDGEGLLSPKEECDYEIRRKPQHTWKKRIKSLFYNTDKVYKMSKKKRGQALIINVERFNGPDALDLTRDGSSMDVKNMKFMLEQFGFELAPVKENPDAQEILDTIKKETQHKNHEDYNAFFLCIMTHGKEDDQILGSDQHTVKLKDIYELLSPLNFPAMAGKPKIIVIQACAGSKRDIGKTGSRSDSPDAAEPQDEPDRSTRPKSAVYRSDNPGPSSAETDSSTEAGSIDHLDVEDLMILKSSFENYSSMRSEKSGSLFIRSLVATFNKHACHRDLYSLCEIVQHRVSTESKILASKYPKYCFGQTVVAIKTFTRLRKVYLFPGYDPRAE